jgi:hypothetical protein
MDPIIRFKTRYIESKIYFLGEARRTRFYLVRSVELVPRPDPEVRLPASRIIPEIFWQ